MKLSPPHSITNYHHHNTKKNLFKMNKNVCKVLTMVESNQSVLDYICWNVFEKKLIKSKCFIHKCGDSLPSIISYSKGCMYVRSITSKTLKIRMKNINDCQRHGNVVFLHTSEHDKVNIRFKNGMMSRVIVNLVHGFMDGRINSKGPPGSLEPKYRLKRDAYIRIHPKD